MNFDSDSPLGEQFLASPYEYLQSYVRNMNNQIFLSEYQINNLYVLLLMGKTSPWDALKPNTIDTKQKIDEIVTKKVAQVKQILQSLSQVYEDKVKRNTFNQIQRLMNIIKAKNKSIFIQKNIKICPCQNHTSSCKNTQNDLKQKIENHSINLVEQQVQKNDKKNQIKINESSQNQINIQDNIQTQLKQVIAQTQAFQRKQPLQVQKSKRQHQNQQQHQQQSQQQHANRIQLEQINNNQKIEQKNQQEHHHHHVEDDRQVMGIFYGIANLPNLSTLAIGNCLDYSAAERYIKFKMSKNYIMTIKNQDELSFDLTSQLSKIPCQTFTHHIFPYLTANQLFKVRGVCRQWMDNVKQAWHSTFKREMYVQLLACQYCKEIQFYYKLIQLRNPFFQKLSLLMHALIQIIQWDKVYEQIQTNTIIPQLKKVLIILMKLIGQPIQLTNLNSITEQIWNANKQKALSLKQRVSAFFSDISSACLSINQLKQIKIHLLDDPFMRLQQVSSEDKTPLLLVIFIKQMTLQQLVRNHIYFSQEYLMNTKRRLDHVSSKMPQQKGFLQGVYKILLLRTMNPFTKEQGDNQKSQMPNFQQLLYSIFDNSQVSKPDFVIKNRSSCTNIYLDKATKLDIIVSTVKKMKVFQQDQPIRRVKRTYYNAQGEQGRTIIYDEDGNQKQIIQPPQRYKEQFEENCQIKQQLSENIEQKKQQAINENIKQETAQGQTKKIKQLKSVRTYDISLGNSKSNQIGINTQNNEQVQQRTKYQQSKN